MAETTDELKPGQVLAWAHEDQSSSAVATNILAAKEVFQYRQGSVQLENNESGGGETVTAKVWMSNKAVPGTPAHAGAADWSQLGSDITLSPGDREVYTWTTPVRWLAVSIVATGAITSKVDARIIYPAD